MPVHPNNWFLAPYWVEDASAEVKDGKGNGEAMFVNGKKMVSRYYALGIAADAAGVGEVAGLRLMPGPYTAV